ncbi:MAG: ABC transporter permease [Acidimicrobiales bacterium]
MSHLIIIVVLVVLVGVRVVLWRRRRARPSGQGAGAAYRPLVLVGLRKVAARFGHVGGDVGLVAAREIRERVRGRTFRVATLIILLAVAAAVAIPVLRKGGHSVERVGVVGALSAPLRISITATGPELGTKVVLVDEPTLDAARRGLRSGRLTLVLVDARKLVVDKALAAGDTSAPALLAEEVSATVSLQNGLVTAGVHPDQAARLAHPRPLPVQSLQPPVHNQAARTTAVYGLILTYVLLTQYGTWLLMGVVEEKSSRVVEVLLSTLRPGQLLAGKVIGIGTVALLQAALIVGMALGLGAALGSTLLHGTAPLVVVGSLVWVVLGYSFYCWVYAAGGSLADRQEQVQSLAFPLQLPILFGYIVSLTSLGAGSPSTLITVLAYLPPTAPFAMPVLLGLGFATWWQFALSCAITLVCIVGVARLAAVIYKRAILRTGGRVHLRDILGAKALPGPA